MQKRYGGIKSYPLDAATGVSEMKDYAECITAAHDHLRQAYAAASLGRVAEALMGALQAQNDTLALIEALEAEMLRREREKRGIAP